MSEVELERDEWRALADRLAHHVLHAGFITCESPSAKLAAREAYDEWVTMSKGKLPLDLPGKSVNK